MLDNEQILADDNEVLDGGQTLVDAKKTLTKNIIMLAIAVLIAIFATVMIVFNSLAHYESSHRAPDESTMGGGLIAILLALCYFFYGIVVPLLSIGLISRPTFSKQHKSPNKSVRITGVLILAYSLLLILASLILFFTVGRFP